MASSPTPPPKNPSPSPPSRSNPSSPPPAATSPPPPTSPEALPPPPAPLSESSPTPPSVSSSPSPPSPPSDSPPPPPPSSSSTPSTPSTSSFHLSSKVIIGVAISGVVVLLLLGLLCICCSMKRRRRRPNHHGNEHYFIPPLVPAPPSTDNYYGGGEQRWQSTNPAGPAKQYMMPKPSPARPPHSPPRPPQTFVSSSTGGSGSNNSGPEGPLPPPSPAVFSLSKNSFTYEELARATNGFSDANILGQGGFGYVHKGLLPNGKEVAVKSLRAGSIQGDREFQAEVEIISRVHHKHLVSLVGYCISGSDRLLVYDFVPNKTLEFHLHGKDQPTMDWRTRLKIALGSAKGLAYLHEDCHPKIIHRDIKAANILLDSKFEAQVADFGLAKFSSDLNTHVSTRVMGTFGYLAPEYASSGKLTYKSDVFSFGVLLLELITGHRPVDTTSSSYADDCLVDWARPLLTKASESNNFDELADPRLQKSYNDNEMARMVACAAACVRHSARRRPRMSQVVRALEGEVSTESDLYDGIRPGHSKAYGSSDYETGKYREDMERFRKIALVSEDYGSSEYGGTTSEYGLYLSSSTSEAHTTREIEPEIAKKDS